MAMCPRFERALISPREDIQRAVGLEVNLFSVLKQLLIFLRLFVSAFMPIERNILLSF